MIKTSNENVKKSDKDKIICIDENSLSIYDFNCNNLLFEIPLNKNSNIYELVN